VVKLRRQYDRWKYTTLSQRNGLTQLTCQHDAAAVVCMSVCLSVCNQLLLFALCRARFVVDLEGSTSPGQMVEPPTEKSEIQVGVCK